jgi:protein-tyrosine-phosphatase
MLIGVACRQNRMRSPFVTAVLLRITRLEFFSFGSAVRPGSQPSETVTELIAELGFHEEWRKIKEHRSKSLQDVSPFLHKTKLVLCLDRMTLDTLQVGLDDELKKIFILAAGDEKVLSASDPVNFTKDQTRLEVYKAALNSIQVLKKYSLLPKTNISAYIPRVESDSSKLFEELSTLVTSPRKHFVISLDFYSPIAHIFKEAGFETKTLESVDKISSQLVQFYHDKSVRLFLGVQFEIPWSYSDIFNELEKITRIGLKNLKISIILPNLDSNVRISTIAILGSWFADEVNVLGTSDPRFAKGVTE